MIPSHHKGSPETPVRMLCNLQALAMVGRHGRAEVLKALVERSDVPIRLREVKANGPTAIDTPRRAGTAAMVRRSLVPLIERRASRGTLRIAARSAGHPILTRAEIDWLVREAIAAFLRAQRRLQSDARPRSARAISLPPTLLHII